MEINYINLKKERDLGEIITDTFQFIRHNYKILLKLILKITWPALLFVLLSLGYYFWSFGADYDFFNINMEAGFGSVYPAGILFSILAMLVAASIFYALLYGTVLGILKSYAWNKGEILEEEVQLEVRSKFWRLWGGGIVAGILVSLGFVLCIIPGVYLMVPLSLISAVIVFQNKDITDSISECFRLIKDNWWITFATILIIGILYYIINFIVQIPLMIYMIFKVFAMSSSETVDPGNMFDWLFIGLNLLFTLAQYILSSIVVVSTGFIYHNLKEQKDFTGTFEEIENLGKDEN